MTRIQAISLQSALESPEADEAAADREEGFQGDTITSQPQDVARIALPLLTYFTVMWVAGFVIGKLIRRATSGQALAGIVGPLTEVPVLVALVYVALWARRFWRDAQPTWQAKPAAG